MGKQWKQWLTIFGGSKTTVDGDCSHEIKRCLLLGRKVMTNQESMQNFAKETKENTKGRFVGQSQSSFIKFSTYDKKKNLVKTKGITLIKFQKYPTKMIHIREVVKAIPIRRK